MKVYILSCRVNKVEALLKLETSSSVFHIFIYALLFKSGIFEGIISGRHLIDFNSFQPSVALYIETYHLTCRANQMTGVYMKCNTGLKWE